MLAMRVVIFVELIERLDLGENRAALFCGQTLKAGSNDYLASNKRAAGWSNSYRVARRTGRSVVAML